eukprot:3150482-Prymnesium_polylepis.1
MLGRAAWGGKRGSMGESRGASGGCGRARARAAPPSASPPCAPRTLRSPNRAVAAHRAARRP